ncbi:hypothetical protein [Enorma burkinafasonensis]|uniref:hypothetical protein n=1 Tax=Enorma burkinafasonensis TaxID=2590867 RepID=UPI0026E9457F|nr:hypothetical protein [Enorma burkinafasonensis]MCI7730706.1 hypothetical protein [Enorma burkinafasonensis]
MEGTNNTINPVDKKAPVMLIARIALAVAAALLVVAFFLPWASADEEFREGAAALPDFMFYEPAGMTVADACDISLLEYAQVYGSMEGTAWVVYMVVMYAGLALSVVALLLAVLGKPIGTAVFAALACAVSRLLVWDFGDRGVLPSSTHDWGVVPTVYLIATAAVIALAAWLFALKRKDKAQRETSVQTSGCSA